MSMRTKSFVFVACVLAIAALVVSFGLLPRELRAPTTDIVVAPPASLDDTIVVDAPLPQSVASSPLAISGRARGSWFFEASAPVSLQDASGTTIAIGHLTAQGDWMTTNYVPFTATLTFTKLATSTVGTLIFKNDNPSGDPAKDKVLEIPVRF